MFGNNFEYHIARLDLVLERMSAAGLKMKPEKCQLLKPEERMHRAHHIAKRHLEVSAKRRKDYYDMKSNLISIEPFDKV